MDLVKYIDSNFEGPSLLPDVSCKSSLLSCLFRKILSCKLIKKNIGKLMQDPEKRKFAEELIAYSDTFVPEVYRSFTKDARTLAGEI